MRMYRIDELAPHEVKKIVERLKEMDLASSVDEIFWLPLPAALLSEEQKKHVSICGPYVMGLEVQENAVNLEFLVRSRTTLHCSCVGYAAPALMLHMIEYLDSLLASLGISR